MRVTRPQCAKSSRGPLGPLKCWLANQRLINSTDDRDSESWSRRARYNLRSRVCVLFKMSTESLPIYRPPEGSDFVDISDVFLDAAQGMPMNWFDSNLPTHLCIDMESGDVILSEDFTLYDAMSALEAMRTRSDPRLLLILVLFRLATLAWTAVSCSMTRQGDPSLIRLLLSFLRRFVIY